MAIDKNTVPNIDDSDPADYPNGQIRDNDGSDNGTPVNRAVFSDIFETFAKLMRMTGTAYNGEFDNESAGYQYIQALKLLAGKNDILQILSSATEVIGGVNTNVLTVPLKIENLEGNELLLCLANVDYAGQTILRGLTPGVYKGIIGSDNFAQTALLVLINGTGGVQIVKPAIASNLNQMVGELNFLKAANQGQEDAGLLSSVATTPATNVTTFRRRVNGADSPSYLASDVQNGLLSAADKIKIDTFEDPTRNRGWFSGVDPGNMVVGTSLPHSGDIASAIVSQNVAGGANDVIIVVTMNNAMTGVNYFVRSHIESQGDLNLDNDLRAPVFKPTTPTTFSWGISDSSGATQSVKIHIEAVQIS